MASDPIPVGEARRRLSSLVERVARGGRPVSIGRYGRERAVLIGADQYAELERRAVGRRKGPATIEGSLRLTCTPQELVAESARIGRMWLDAVGSATRKRRHRRG
jgi:prevent-host-death family protein